MGIYRLGPITSHPMDFPLKYNSVKIFIFTKVFNSLSTKLDYFYKETCKTILIFRSFEKDYCYLFIRCPIPK